MTGAGDHAELSAAPVAPDPLYVAARRVLLDALVALGAHRDAVIVAGAQAVYLHTGKADLSAAVAPYTTDGDLALDLGSARVDRLVDKDAADVLRLMQAFAPAEVGAVFARLSEDPLAAAPSRDALAYLEQLFGRRGRPGIEMAARALRPSVPADGIEALCVAYIAALLGSIEGQRQGS